MYWRSFFVKHKNRIAVFSLAFLVVILLVMGTIYYLKNNNEISIISKSSPAIAMNEEIKNGSLIMVHVKGAVKNPGLYELNRGSRINDAVKIAGDVTENADLDRINLAEFVEDGQEIIVPSKNSEINDGKIDINQATKDELMTLPGIGEVFADKIISYREKVGRFKSVDDLLGVTGIGESKLKEIKDLIKAR